MAEFERVEAIGARAEEDGYAPDSNALKVLTGTRRLDNQKNESWCQVDMCDPSKDELVLIVKPARVHGLLPKTTRTYCCIHTAVRHCNIAARIEVPFPFIKLKEDARGRTNASFLPTASERVQAARPRHALASASWGWDRPSSAAQRCRTAFACWDSILRALSDFKPRATGAVLEPNAPVAAAFANACDGAAGPGRAHIAYITVDKSDGGGEASFSLVDHLVEGAWTPSGDVTMMTAEDARRELDIAGVDAATGVESCLLNVAGDVFGEGGFLAGLVPVKDESGVAALFRLWRALLVVEKIELVVMGADFGMRIGRRTAARPGAPMTLLEKPVWEWDEVPTFEEISTRAGTRCPCSSYPTWITRL